MMRLTLLILIAALMLGGVTACGGSSSGESSDASASTQAAGDDAAARKKKEEAARRAAEAEAEEMAASCQEEMEDFQDKITELNSRLSVGLNYDEYTDAVADAKVEYDRIDFDALSDNPLCLATVGVPLEAALNKYVRAAKIWSDCFDDFACDNDQITSKLQARWAKATRSIENAEDGLRALGDPDLD